MSGDRRAPGFNFGVICPFLSVGPRSGWAPAIADYRTGVLHSLMSTALTRTPYVEQIIIKTFYR